jgi:hypothetical protein
MPRSKQRKATPEHPPKASPTARKPWRSLPHQIFFGAIPYVATVVGGLSALFFFLPRVNVETAGPYDESNPSVSFTITNNNIVPLHNVQPIISPCVLIISNIRNRGFVSDDPNCDKHSFGGGLAFAPWHVTWLDPDEKYQIFLEDALRSQATGDRTELITSANVILYVEYSPWLMPWRSTAAFRFITHAHSDGKIYWVPTPVNK